MGDDRAWQRLESAHRYGDCLLTISTGALSEAEAARAGLVPTHAYAVLDAREVDPAAAGLHCSPVLAGLKSKLIHVSSARISLLFS